MHDDVFMHMLNDVFMYIFDDVFMHMPIDVLMHILDQRIHAYAKSCLHA